MHTAPTRQATEPARPRREAPPVDPSTVPVAPATEAEPEPHWTAIIDAATD